MGRTSVKQDIVEAYTDPVRPGSFTSPSKIRKTKFRGVSLKQIRESLMGTDAFTKHKRYIRKFPRLKTQTGGIDKQWQLDLIDMQSFSKSNRGFKHILVAVDVFSRYGFAVPVKSKKGEDIVKAFKIMLKERQPAYVQTDKGKEFLNHTFQAFLKSRGIEFFTSENDDIKCSIAERFNGTLQGKMWRYFTHANTFSYCNVLQDLVKSYNDTPHKTLGVAPSEVNETNSEKLYYSMYERPRTSTVVPALKPGDHVRILQTKKTFNRGYEPNWSEEIFVVASTQESGYRLKDMKGEGIKGRFYPQEVQKISVSPSKRFSVEKILRTRTRGKKKEALIKWKGYSDKFNTWEPVRHIT